MNRGRRSVRDYKLPSGFERCGGSDTSSAALVLRLKTLLRGRIPIVLNDIEFRNDSGYIP